MTLHDRALARYGGSPGLRDAGALSSALAQPAMEAFGVGLYPSLVEKAAAVLPRPQLCCCGQQQADSVNLRQHLPPRQRRKAHRPR
ncbi:hypothetical protein [Deinococcus apachensis]|uniref:hypothetical protein n=1 Tax=Deinococcus apachensis TaxID=309886 RepID=UPI003CCC1FBD